MKAVHFGAGNIGRGFIGEVLHKNGVEVVFVDIAETIIDALNERGAYEISLAAPRQKRIAINQVRGVNNQLHPDLVVDEIVDADLITTAIGPNILKYIAPLIAQGLQKRVEAGNVAPIDVMACENMIGGSQKLKEYVFEDLEGDIKDKVEEWVGFPNAAVDRIIPMQTHEDPLFVSVEPFSEWIVDQTQMKNKSLMLTGVDYVESLEPFIERKLFSVNTGHATVAYAAKLYGYETIKEGIEDKRVIEQLRAVLKETGELLIDKWAFNPSEHKNYQETIVERFSNPYISDEVVRVGRTPIRKLGYNERFILPIRELKARGLTYQSLLDTVGMIFHYDDAADAESVELQKMLSNQPVDEVVQEVTGLDEPELIEEIVSSIQKYNQ